MNSKRIVYFDQNQQGRTRRRKQSTTRQNVSISKVIRDTSVSKLQRGQASNRGNYGEKGTSSQKIKILLTKDGFMFQVSLCEIQKKYMIYDMQCTLIRPVFQKGNNDQETQSNPAIESLIPALIFQQKPTQQDFLLLSLEGSTIGITKGTVRHNFTLEKDNANYIEIRINEYSLDNFAIANKRVEFVEIQANQINFNDIQITIVQPVKFVEGSQLIRQSKIQEYNLLRARQKTENRKGSKSLSFCWNIQPTHENAESVYKVYKRFDQDSCISSARQQPSPTATPSRQNSKSKRINTSLVQPYSARQNGHKQQFSELMRPKQKDLGLANNVNNSYGSGCNSSRIKVGSKKSINDMTVHVNGKPEHIARPNGKQNGNKLQDAYGLEEIGKKSRIKTAHTQNHKASEAYQIEPVRGVGGFGKKNQ